MRPTSWDDASISGNEVPSLLVTSRWATATLLASSLCAALSPTLPPAFLRLADPNPSGGGLGSRACAAVIAASSTCAYSLTLAAKACARSRSALGDASGIAMPGASVAFRRRRATLGALGLVIRVLDFMLSAPCKEDPHDARALRRAISPVG